MFINRWRLALLTMLALGVVFAAQTTQPAPIAVLAQGDDSAACTTLIREAVREIGSDCAELGRNEACYGNTLIDATLSDSTLTFAEGGDIVEIGALESLATAPADPTNNTWGIALLDLQADLPESGDGNVRMVVFGGVDVTPVNTAAAGFDATCALSNDGDQNINLRVGPNTSFAAVDTLQPGEALTGYGVSADGEWVRAAEGWIFASITTNDCSGAGLPVFDEASEAYLAPMQNFTLTLGEGGSCAAAPDGLLVQAPEGTTANIMINNVEIRLGSTAFITIDDAENALVVANLDGDVVVTSDERSRRIRVGEETTVALAEVPLGTEGNAAGAPTYPRPFTSTTQTIDENLLSLLPETFTMPSPAAPRNVDDALDEGRPDAPGQYLGCGSCNTCGYAERECITTPDGTCTWDPATCRDAFYTERGQSFKGPFEIQCTEGDLGSYRLVYTDKLGENGLVGGASTSNPTYATVGTIAPLEMFVNYTCPYAGQTQSVTVTAQDTLGNVLLWSTILVGN